MAVGSASRPQAVSPACRTRVTYKLLENLTKQVRSGGQASTYLVISEKGKNYNQKHLCIVSFSAAGEMSHDLEEHLISYSILLEKGSMVWAMN